jgi:capsular polysaccharide transport system permease protein
MSDYRGAISQSFTALGNWRTVVGTAMTYEVGGRFRGNRLGLILAFAEPFLILMVLLLLRVFFRQQLAHFGQSAVVFLSSGILPYFLYIRLSGASRKTKYLASQRLPRVSSTNLMIAKNATSAAVYLFCMLVYFVGLVFIGLDDAIPESPMTCLTALFFLAGLGIGFGLVNSAISVRFPMWNYFFGFANRLLIFVSGVFYVADLMPLYRRDWLEFNPLAHGIIWFRVGLYGPAYPHLFLDVGYMMLWSCGMLLLGLVAHRATLRT